MASCFVVTGLVLIALAFIASAVSFVAPFWMHQLPITNQGLWAVCHSDNKCTWFFENDFKWEDNLPLWWKAAQGLFAFGVLFLLTAFLTACVFLCSACCKSLFVVHLVNGLLVLAFITEGIALGLFGAKAYEEFNASYDRGTTVYFDWAFWVGCGGVLVDLIAILFYTCEGCRSGNSSAGYMRGEVV
jgi:hypothetical protein